MSVKRIVADIETANPREVAAFYERIFGLKIVMDHGFIITSAAEAKAPIQVSFATEGGSGTPVPGLSIEVDDLDEVLANVQEADVGIEYGPFDEPWGVRRFFIRDPAGTLLNILNHND
ncbi:MAG: VOC family protein [Rhizobiaceae bacterium]